MSKQRILNEDWEDYDNRKLRVGDRNFFSTEEPWEVTYLINKIRIQYPALFSENDIRNAISACARDVPAPRPRQRFVECVLHRLGINK